MKELTKFKNSEPIVVDHLDYLDYHVDFYEDPVGGYYYCLLKGNLINFGSDNTMYKEDCKNLIDSITNTI